MARVIVVAGEALIDLILGPDGRLDAVPGGGPFNTARTIARLGGAVAFLGRLSTDRFGGLLRDALTGDGVDLSFAATTDAPTTLAVAELDARGAATYRFHTAETSAPGLSRDAVLAVVATRPRALHVGSLGLVLEPIASALAAGVAAADEETLVMVDANCRPLVIRDRDVYVERLHAVITRSDVVKVSGDDLDYLMPGMAHPAAARRHPGHRSGRRAPHGRRARGLRHHTRPAPSRSPFRSSRWSTRSARATPSAADSSRAGSSADWVAPGSPWRPTCARP